MKNLDLGRYKPGGDRGKVRCAYHNCYPFNKEGVTVMKAQRGRWDCKAVTPSSSSLGGLIISSCNNWGLLALVN